MKYCPYCGYKVENSYAFCPKCGRKIPEVEAELPRIEKSVYEIPEERGSFRPEKPEYRPEPEYRREPEYHTEPEPHPDPEYRYVPAWKDYDYEEHREEQVIVRTEPRERSGGFGWWLLGFLLPLVGLIIFLADKDRKPGRASSASNGALTMLILITIAAAVLMVLVLSGYISLV